MVLAEAVVEVSSLPHDGETLYRARRMGLTADAASAVCAALVRSGQSCFVVRREGLRTRLVEGDAS
jgi:hypothetical protein